MHKIIFTVHEQNGHALKFLFVCFEFVCTFASVRIQGLEKTGMIIKNPAYHKKNHFYLVYSNIIHTFES
jgi:hypothetical protein